MNRIILVVMGLLLPITLVAQDRIWKDSLKNIYLPTVVISSSKNKHIDFHGKRYDGQANTERLLQDIPGINLISRGNFAQEPAIRGMSDGQISLTIDGMRLFGACTDRMDPITSYIEPNNMESVQVATGPQFGTGASIGGGMVFNLKRAELKAANPWSGSVGTGYETNAHAFQFLGNVQYSAKRLAISVDGIFRKAGDYRPGGKKSDNIEKYSSEHWTPEQGFTVNEKGQINYSQYQKWNLHVNALYQLNSHQWLNADYVQDEGTDIGYPALTMDVAFARTKMGSLTHIYRNSNKPVYYWKTKVYYNNINHAMDDTKRPKEQIPMHMDMPGRSKTGGIYTEMYMKASDNHLIRLKAETYVNRWTANMTMYPDDFDFGMFMLTIPDAQRSVIGIDASDEIRINDTWKLIPAVHGEYNRSSIYSSEGKTTLTSIYSGNPDKTRWLYNASVALHYKTVSPLTGSLKLSRGMRAPTLKEAYAFYLFDRHDGYDYLGYPDIKNEKSVSAELSLSYHTQNLKIGVKGFGYSFHNYITGFVQPEVDVMNAFAYGVKQFGNISSAYLYGLSLTVDWDITERFSFSHNTSWQRGKDKNSHYLPMMPPLTTESRMKYKVGNWHFYIEEKAAASQKEVSSFYGESQTPGFAITNLGADKTFYFGNRDLILSLTVNNLFNTYYYEHLDIIKVPREGRNFIFHVTYSF